MKGFLSSLKKLTTNDSSNNQSINQPTNQSKPSNIAIAAPATPSSAAEPSTPQSINQRQSINTPSHSQSTNQSNNNQSINQSINQSDEKLKASKQARSLTENLITLSSTIFDQSKFVINQSTNFSTAFDALYTRDLEADIGRAEMTVKSILIDLPNLAKLSQEDISSTNSLIASNLDFCKALRSRGADRLIEHRKLALISDERLKKKRADLNAQLKAEWEAGAKLHEMDTNALMSEYGARPINPSINQSINQSVSHSASIEDEDAEIETSVDPHLHDDDEPEPVES